jgi:TonB family protein
MQCPRCGYSPPRRSRIRKRDWPFLLFLRRPYRCLDCKYRWRSFLWRFEGTSPAGDVTGRIVPVHAGRKSKAGWIVLAALVAVGIMGRTRLIQWFELERSRPVFRSSQSPSPEPEPPKPSPPAVPDASIEAQAAHSPNRSSETPPRPPAMREDKTVAADKPAEAIRAERPVVPPEVKSAITSDNVVNVRVVVDESGKVTAATVVSTSGRMASSLTPYAVQAARAWRFKPARQNGKAVRSDKVLQFLFRAAGH